jgi:hypothetical protein
MASKNEANFEETETLVESEPEVIKKPENLSREKILDKSKKTLNNIELSAKETISEGSIMLGESLNSLDAAPDKLMASKEAIDPINDEITELAEESENKIKKLFEDEKKENKFDRNKFIEESRAKIEQATSPENLMLQVKEILREQSDRKDLDVLFSNFKFTGDNDQEISLTTSDYFQNNISEIDRLLNDPEKLDELKQTPLDALKKEMFGSLDDLIIPSFNAENGADYKPTISKIQAKAAVSTYDAGNLVTFINKYAELSKNREEIFDKFIFKDYPEKKDSFFEINNDLNALMSDSEAISKIDVISSGNLNETLNLLDNDEYYQTKYPEPMSPEDLASNDSNSSIVDLDIDLDTKGVSVFNTPNAQSARISLLLHSSLKSLELAKENEFFKISNGDSSRNGIDSSDINLITEQRLRGIKDFSANLKILNPNELVYYKNNLENLKPEIKDFLKQIDSEKVDSGQFYSIGNYYSFFKFAENEENFNKIKKTYEVGLLPYLFDSEILKKAISLDDNDLDLLIRTGQDLSTPDYVLNEIKKLDADEAVKYREIKKNHYVDDERGLVEYVKDLKEIPLENIDFFNRWQEAICPPSRHAYVFYLKDFLKTALKDKESLVELDKLCKSDDRVESVLFKYIANRNIDLATTLERGKHFVSNPKDYFIDNPEFILSDFENVQSVLKNQAVTLNQEDLDLVFNEVLKNNIGLLNIDSKFPFTVEQKKILDIFAKINNSQSREMKNMAPELSVQIAQSGDTSEMEDKFKKIENIFIKNNIPFVGKQMKICEALHPEIETSKISSPELQSIPSNNAKRLLIFKDLLRTSFSSLNSNLEQYLNIFKNGQDVLDKYESGTLLNNDEEDKLKYFFKKINALSENTKKTTNFKDFDLDNISLENNLKSLKSNFGIKGSQTITEKFEKTFLNRIGISNFSEALKYYDSLRGSVSKRNEQLALSGQITLNEDDLAKGTSLDFFDSNLDRGIYAPEFVGAESAQAKDVAKGSDSTPWDTDLIKVGKRSSLEIVEKSIASNYGEIILIVKDRGQFNKNDVNNPLAADPGKMELFKTAYLGQDHYGIRTGFGSSEIDAIMIKDDAINDNKKLDSLKFSIAKKGFYIPICDKTGKVIFTAEDYNKYKEIFNGIDKHHGDKITVDESWKQSKFNENIQEAAQTRENLDKINDLRNFIYSDIENDLKSFGMELHKGRYDDSVVGAKIVDTGSTGRGAALDNGYDFDFAIKIDDRDESKIEAIVENLKNKYPFKENYTSAGMATYRFKSFEKDGNIIDLDISFIKKSDSEELDANEAVSKKYDSIKEQSGEDKLLEVLTNVRYAKKELKKAGCYKKGLTGNGEQQGGLGGIGVENWILKNGGNAVAAFQEFNKNAYQNGELVSFNDFKRNYKIFSAGENIRGSVRAENFVYNMDPVGYQKMAELSGKFIDAK